jgi:hypothetical protein
LIIGLVIAERYTQPIEFKCFGVDKLKVQLELFLRPTENPECWLSLLAPKIVIEQPEPHIERSLREVLDCITARAIASEVGQEEANPKVPDAHVSGEMVPGHSQSIPQTETGVSQMAIRNRLEFAGDIVSAIFKGYVFITSSISIRPWASGDPFVGLSELQSALAIRAEDPKLVTPTEGGAKAKMVKSGKMKRALTRTDVRKDGSSVRMIENDDLHFFLFMAPFIIPCELLVQMIREEQRKAVRVRKG